MERDRLAYIHKKGAMVYYYSIIIYLCITAQNNIFENYYTLIIYLCSSTLK